MHPRNIHNKSYDFDKLISAHKELESFVFTNDYNTKTIDFSSADAVFHLNKALLKAHYNIIDWTIPKGYLCPPIPSRVDYIHHIADLISEDQESRQPIKGLDIGVGANCIYPILGAQIYKWHMVGVDIHKDAVDSALNNVSLTPSLKSSIEIVHQTDNANIFKNLINEDDYYHFTMCNPPFHNSKEEATKGTLRKLKQLKNKHRFEQNFGGQANELWCNGGESLFIKRMIKQSVLCKKQVGWFTTLVSKKDHLPKLEKQLNKLNAEHKTIAMTHGNKHTRFLAWRF